MVNYHSKHQHSKHQHSNQPFNHHFNQHSQDENHNQQQQQQQHHLPVNQHRSSRANEHTRRLRERIEAANKYLEQRNYTIMQRNGQRISTHRTLHVDASVEGPREVFIGKLPRDLFEDELLPKMEKAGRVQNMRLMMDFSSSNRGFAFAKYVTPQEAHNACLKVNGTLIRDGELPIGVLLSFDNRRLYMGNLPAKSTKETLRKELDKVITGVTDIQLPECGSAKQDTRYAFVSFETHEAATQARRVLCPGNIKICDRIVTVDWARPDLPKASQSPSPPSPPSPPSLPSPPPPPLINYNDILGERARQMLAACPPDPACTILVKNINRNEVDETKLKLILQLGDKLKVLALNPIGPNSIEVTYSEPRQALFMSNLLTEHSQSFERIALPERKIAVARPMAIMDLNANYYQPMPSPDSMFNYNQNNILARTVKGLLYNNETFN